MSTATTTEVKPTKRALAGDGRPTRSGLVRRDRLIASLGESTHKPVVTVVAPAGYGKTTILSDWAEQDSRPFAWVALDERHNDPVLMLREILTILDQIEPVSQDVFAPLAMPRASISSSVLARLQEALSARELPFVLVLDDLHLVKNPEGTRPLEAIADSMPGGSQLAIASRTRAPLPLGRLRAEGKLCELGADHLRMTVSEARESLAACGLKLTEDSVRLLVDRTEGWPVGLYLAGLSLVDSTQPEAAIADFHGDDRIVADYLQDAFFAGLDRDTIDFLVQSSILDRLSGDVCDVVLRRTGSAETLRRLMRSNLMIVPLDRRNRFYRLHPLFRDLLVSELDRLDPLIAAGLHDRASEFFSERGDFDRAIPHGIASGDPEHVADLILANTAAYVASGRHATVSGWLDGFTKEQTATIPALAIAEAICLLAGGHGAEIERWTGIALEQLDGAEEADPAMTVMARIIRAAGASRDGVTQMLEDIDAGIELLASDDPLRVLCNLLKGAGLHLTNRREEARRSLEDGARSGSSLGPSVAALCRAQLALLELDEGDLAEAERQSQIALGTVEHFGLGDYQSHALTFAVAALVCARRGRTDAAAQHAKATVRLQGGLDDLSPWYEAEVRITLARALLLLDDVVAARSNLAAAGRFLRNTSDAIVLRDWLDEAWAEADTAGSVEGRWPLTPAELRLLHMLPTHYSFREIAEHGFVSQNTVKTQAQSVYRKLGVSSRAEAVVCAKAAGLLGADPQDSP